LAYIKRVAQNLQSRIHLNQECVSAQWLEDTDLWKVEFLDITTNEAFVRHSRVLLTAVGFLDIPKGPESIANIQEFRGRIFHSSDWDHEVDFKGKDVVVVGNGASANQFVPWLLKNTGLRNLVQVVRSAQWIAPKDNQRIGKVQKW
jgi:cation diffusion facilitator CzcD-associated flavoprotein CzcO